MGVYIHALVPNVAIRRARLLTASRADSPARNGENMQVHDFAKHVCQGKHEPILASGHVENARCLKHMRTSLHVGKVTRARSADDVIPVMHWRRRRNYRSLV